MRIWKYLSNIGAYGIGLVFIIFEFILEDTDRYIVYETVGYSILIVTFVVSEIMKFMHKRGRRTE